MTFQELNLSKPLLRAVSKAGYQTPSPIQAGAIPPVLAGRDLMGCAQTGTGKTAAFALPMLQLLASRPAPKKGAIRALILTPTRELALQIGENFALFGEKLPLRSTVIFGGVGQNPQVEAIKRGVDILIACPGRLNDLIGQGFIDLSLVEIFVLDEADRMLDMGFVHDVKKVIAKLPARRQNLMFSATMPAEIEQLANSILREPAFVKVDPVSSTVDRIHQSLYYVEKGNKRLLLPWLIQNLQPPVTSALVFSRTKHGADKIARDLTKQGIPAAAIHGNKSQNARVAALEGFKAGKTRVLVATDIAARGIDISELSHVFNYDLPEVPETYVHRIGRTARAGAEGIAISFCAPEEQEYLAGIEKLNRKKIPVVPDHPWAGAPAPALLTLPRLGRAAKSQQPKKEEIIMQKNEKRPAAQEGEGSSRRRRRSRSKEAPAQAQQPRTERRSAAPARGSNAQPKFDPHFLSASSALPSLSHPVSSAAPVAQAARPQTPALPRLAAPKNGPARGKNESQNQNRPKNAEGQSRAKSGENRSKNSDSQPQNRGKNPEGPSRAKSAEAQNQNRPKSAEAQNQNRAKNEQAKNQPRSGRTAPAAPAAQPANRPGRPAGRAAGTGRGRSTARDDDPGLLLISRRPPQQKFASFDEYMTAHGGATAPIEDHSEE